MEVNSFDIDGLLTDEEAQQLFAESEQGLKTPPEEQVDGGEEQKPDESEIDNADAEASQQEIVGEENNREREGAQRKDAKASSSPDVFYSSIARAAKQDGIFSNLDDEFIEKIKTPEDFGEALEKEVSARLDETQRRINEMMGMGADASQIRQTEQLRGTIEYLKGISPDALDAENEQGEELRKSILYNDFISKGFSQERAQRELKKAFSAGTDIEDAHDALTSLRQYYEKQYDGIVAEQKKQAEAVKAQQRKNYEEFRKMVLEDEIALGDQKLSKQVRQRIYDAAQKPVYKDEATGKLLTEVQRFQKEHPLEFLKQISMWYVLTNGGKDLTGFTKDKVTSEKHKAMRELETKIIIGSNDGDMRYMGGSDGDDKGDVLLSDDWKVGYNG